METRKKNFDRFLTALNNLDMPEIRTITVWTEDLKDFPGLSMRLSHLIAENYVTVTQFQTSFTVVQGDERVINLIYGRY